MTQVVSQQKLKSAAAGAKPQTALYRGPSHPPPPIIIPVSALDISFAVKSLSSLSPKMESFLLGM